MKWEQPHTRGAGLIVDLLRDRWRHATLYALEHGRLQPGAVLDVFRGAAEEKRNITVFGEHTVYQACVYRHMGELFKGGVIERHAVRGSSPETFYQLTDIARGVLSAIGPAVDFGLTIFPQLVDLSQDFRGNEHVPVELPDLSRLPPADAARVRRRVAVLMFGVLLHPTWTLSILAGLSGGTVRLGALAEAINRSIAANADIIAARSVSRPTIHAGLGRLRMLGYVRQVDDPGGRNPRRLRGAPERASALTVRGHALLDALVPAAEFGIAHDAELTIMARALMRDKTIRSPKRGTFPPSGSSLNP
jgi:DNA-binding HxlR family transcriptional regulator